MRSFLRIGFWMVCALGTTLARPARADASSAGELADGSDHEGDADTHVTVVLRADDPRATLERRAKVETVAGLPFKDATLGSVATWTPECTSPCNVKLDPRFTYRVAGDGLVPSDSFVLPRSADPLLVDAEMGSATGRLEGLALTGLGAGGVVLGVTALAVSPVLAQDDVGSPALRTGVLASGIAVTALSSLVLGAGLWLWNHSDTKVRRDPLPAISF